MAVFQVMAEACSEVAGQADVMKFAAAVQGIDTLAVADVARDDVLVLLKGVAGDVL